MLKITLLLKHGMFFSEEPQCYLIKGFVLMNEERFFRLVFQ